jgi:hypothetical protein
VLCEIREEQNMQQNVHTSLNGSSLPALHGGDRRRGAAAAYWIGRGEQLYSFFLNLLIDLPGSRRY